MKKALKVTAFILGALLILFGLGISYIQFAPAPTYSVGKIPDMQVEAGPERVAEGSRIASMLCNDCHLGDDGKLSGKWMQDVPPAFGQFYSANITQHPEQGIGSWTDGELYYFLRTGLRKDGSLAGIMPQFSRVSDEELMSIIAFLRSEETKVQPSGNIPPASQFAFLGKLLQKFVFGPSPFPAQPVSRPDTLSQVALGRYLADDLYSCYDCHSASFTSNNKQEPAKSKGFYGGGNELLDMDGRPIYSSNLTPDDETGIGRYSEKAFIQALKYGQRPDGSPIRYPMRPHTAMTDEEVKAIFAYLRSIPPIHNPVVITP